MYNNITFIEKNNFCEFNILCHLNMDYICHVLYFNLSSGIYSSSTEYNELFFNLN